jgi:hypothetical protein
MMQKGAFSDWLTNQRPNLLGNFRCYTQSVGNGFTMRRWQSSVLGLMLCLLAALFAFEAKIACYSPEGSPGIQISALKLQQTDASRLVAEVFTARPTLPGSSINALIMTMVLAISFVQAMRPVPKPAFVGPFSPGFFPNLFFRPPPSV